MDKTDKTDIRDTKKGLMRRTGAIRTRTFFVLWITWRWST